MFVYEHIVCLFVYIFYINAQFVPEAWVVNMCYGLHPTYYKVSHILYSIYILICTEYLFNDTYIPQLFMYSLYMFGEIILITSIIFTLVTPLPSKLSHFIIQKNSSKCNFLYFQKHPVWNCFRIFICLTVPEIWNSMH